MMKSIIISIVCFNLLVNVETSNLSYNQPIFSSCPKWNPNAITFASSTLIGSNPWGIFIDLNNTVYLTDRGNNRVLVWSNGSESPTRILQGGLTYPRGLFVTINGDIYVDNGESNGRVDRWILNNNISENVMNGNSPCYGLFVDITNSLYCALHERHEVVKRWLNSSSITGTRVAGNGTTGSAVNMLNGPYGIFVDTNLDLYVVDYGNDRIQLFRSGEVNGITVAGSESLNTTISLSGPTDVILDGNKYLFILDHGNHRIVGQGPSGFQCLVGCSGSPGSSADQLSYPSSLSFDCHGNLFVADHNNHRLQKFLLATNSCESLSSSQSTTTIEQQITTEPMKQSSTSKLISSTHFDLSYNQPIFTSSAKWNSDAITFANSTLLGSNPRKVFIDINNTVYLTDFGKNRVLVWSNGSESPTRILQGGLSDPRGLFVTINGDIYVDNGGSNGRVDRWTLNNNISERVMNGTSRCYGLFVDIANSLYCSVYDRHEVVKRWLNSSSMTGTHVAGNGTAGFAVNMLNGPLGIFVDTNLDLYVADWENNRIQLFRSGEVNGITVAGDGSLNTTISLSHPSDVILDGSKYLFIMDQGNHRIVGEGPSGFQCLVGCSRSSGSSADRLDRPSTLSFDSHGNLFVVDRDNNRLQKFLLATNSCGSLSSSQSTRTIEQQITTEPLKQSSTSKLISSTHFECSSIELNLFPTGSSLSFPLYYRRNQDFYLLSSIRFSCQFYSSFSFQFQWIITNCSSSTFVCSNQIQFDSQLISTTSSELFIPSRTLSYGLYEIHLIFTVSSLSIKSSSIFIQITSSGITANLIPLGTSMITHDVQQDLRLDPGKYSIDPDGYSFNASNWIYRYYCRLYGQSMFPNLDGSLLTIDDPREKEDRLNPSCFSNEQGLKYFNSSIIILSNSLQSNRTYQWMVSMINRLNSSLQATGYLLLHVVENPSPTIFIGCVIQEMCLLNLEFQLLNPTTQISLYSICDGNCSRVENINWNIYFGAMNSSFNVTQWTLFNSTHLQNNRWFFGQTTKNFTATKDLFSSHLEIELWKFEVVYQFPSGTSRSALNFRVNRSPSNGSCSIHPSMGTITTSFNVSCPHWFDQDQIKDYSLYLTNKEQRLFIAFSLDETFEVYLPTGQWNLIVSIRDRFDCRTEWNLSNIIVKSDENQIQQFISSIIDFSSPYSHPILQLLSTGNLNLVGQIITSISNQINEQSLSNEISLLSFSVSTLWSKSPREEETFVNSSILSNRSEDEINRYSTVREYLIQFLSKDFPLTSSSIQLQSSSLAQLTQSTNQLTRKTIILAMKKCHQLSFYVSSISRHIPYEDVQLTSTQLIQSLTNLLTAVNGPLQQRIAILHSDLRDDLENDFEQIELAREVLSQSKEIISLLTSSLKIHLNLEQEMIIDTPEVFMSLQTLTFTSLPNRTLEQVGNASISLPSHLPLPLPLHLTPNTSISIRSMMEPLATFDPSQSQSETSLNLSTSLSLSLLDPNGDELHFHTDINDPIEIFIPRDRNFIMPPMIRHNVTSIDANTTDDHLLFHFLDVNLESSLPISVHFEMRPLNISLAFVFLYKFTRYRHSSIDGWTRFCPLNLTKEKTYHFYLDNEQTLHHSFVIIGLRELNDKEAVQICSPTSLHSLPSFDEAFRFTSDYELRLYTSGCYYRDDQGQWKSDGLRVGPLTNHHQTQCFSTRL